MSRKILNNITMKKSILSVITSGLLILFFSSCGDSKKNNSYLGELPSISKKYQDKQDELEEKTKTATDLNDAFKYGQEAKLAKEEGKKAIEEYLETKTFETPLLFDNNPENKYEILNLNVEGASMTRVNLIATVKINEDIKNKYGRLEKYLFGYIKAVDKSGTMLGKPTVLASAMGGQTEPLKAGTEVVLKGSIGNLREFEEFDKIVFLTKEEYEAVK
jgi:hypothetical protein